LLTWLLLGADLVFVIAFAVMFGYLIRLKRNVDLLMCLPPIVATMRETQNNLLIVLHEEAVREVLNAPLGVTRNSPMVIPAEVAKQFHPFIDQVKLWYDDKGRFLDDHEAWLYIAAKWKDELDKFICEPLAIEGNAAAAIALSMVRQTGDSWKKQ
jgi:hypothetical protein